jgi:hypothetical protein
MPIPSVFLAKHLDPGLALLAAHGGPPPSHEARRFLLAVAMQESGSLLAARYQGCPAAAAGPARGFWQFERGGGVSGVLHHPASRGLARTVCADLAVIPEPAASWRALEGSDLLAAMFARLLLFTDPHKLPTRVDEGWLCYLRLWRPGKPREGAWPENWARAERATAIAAVGA